jgi:hypothetical protein
MNREEKRNIEKQLRAKGYSKNKIKSYFDLMDRIKKIPEITEGTRVKLNMEVIKTYINFDKQLPLRRQWILDHQDEVFTVVYDKNHKTHPSIVNFYEDKSEPKWLFWTGELVVVND